MTPKISMGEQSKEDTLKIVVEDNEVLYWKKAKTESDTMLEKLTSSIKYETAVNNMCKMQLEIAEELSKNKA